MNESEACLWEKGKKTTKKEVRKERRKQNIKIVKSTKSQEEVDDRCQETLTKRILRDNNGEG